MRCLCFRAAAIAFLAVSSSVSTAQSPDTPEPDWVAQFGGSGDAAALAVDIAAVGPNPSRGGATVRLTHEAPGPISVDVVDALGRTVAVLYRGMSEAGEHRWALPAGLAAGAYVVRVSGAITARQAVTVVR